MKSLKNDIKTLWIIYDFHYNCIILEAMRRRINFCIFFKDKKVILRKYNQIQIGIKVLNKIP